MLHSREQNTASWTPHLCHVAFLPRSGWVIPTLGPETAVGPTAWGPPWTHNGGEILGSYSENGSGGLEEVSPFGFMLIVQSTCTSTSPLIPQTLKRPIIYVFLMKTHIVCTKEETINRIEKSRQTHFLLLKKKKKLTDKKM